MDFEPYNVDIPKGERHHNYYIPLKQKLKEQNAKITRNNGAPLKHSRRMWASLRWIILIVSILFAIGYVGILMVVPPFSGVEGAYPGFWGKVGFYIHAFPGSVWLILGALQQFSHIRAKNPTAHRVMGYIALICLFVSISGGMIICLSGETEGGLTLAIDGVVMFIGWGICGAFGWYYIKFQYNVDLHREWMSRAYLLSYVIVVMRPPIIVLTIIVPHLTPGEALAIVAPLFFALGIVIIETHIRRQRASQVNTETHYLSLPKAPLDVQDPDHEHQLITYRRDFVRVKLVQKQELTHNTSLFVFQLPVKASLLMFPGHHVVLRQLVDNQLVIRPYTPVTSLVRYLGNGTHDNHTMQSMNISGTFALAVKRYPNGAMSSWLHDTMSIGDTVEMMGPMGGFYYYPNEYDAIGLIAGGSGITPVFSVLMSALANSNDKTKFSLIYANSNERDIIFRDELQQLSAKFPERFDLHLTKGRLNREVLLEHLPLPGDATQILVCGPIGFATTVQHLLRNEKYPEHTVFTFGESDK